MKGQPADQRSEIEEENEVIQLEADIRDRLRHFVRDFRVTVQDGALILYGQAQTYYGKQLVQHRVMKWGLLPIRANKIDVR